MLCELSVIPQRTEAAEEPQRRAAAAWLRAALAPVADVSLRGAHAEGFYFYLFNSRQELELRSKLDFDRHRKTFGRQCTLMGTLVHFRPLWVPRPTEFSIWQVPQLIQSPVSLQSAPEQFFV